MRSRSGFRSRRRAMPGPRTPSVHFSRLVEASRKIIQRLGIALLMMGIHGVGVFVGIGLLSLGYRYFFIKKLGGVTGDILGGANELAELLCLLLVVILETIHF